MLSRLGVCSRKQAVELLLAGQVAVNGRPVRDPGARCRFTDALTVGGRAVGATRKRYLLLHKPPGVVTTRSDERGRATVYDLLPKEGDWLVAAGRLDRDSEGLLLLTNDTRFAAWITDPANHIPRVYEVTVRPGMTEQEVASLLEGVDIGRGERSVPAAARLIGAAGNSATVELTLVEGRNREVRRLFRARSRRVLRLRRTAFGPFRLGDLEPGAWTEAPITEREAGELARGSP